MRDFPVFTTEYGVASLFLKEIPYRQTAYVIIRDSLEPEKLLAECVQFCRVCGAEKIFAGGHECLEQYPLHAVIYEMSGCAEVDETKVESIWPVTEETVAQWRRIYNDRMREVDNSATQEGRDEKRILETGDACFVHRSGELLGIGWIDNGELLVVAAVKPGAGERIMHTMMSLIPGQQLKLEVVSTNTRAIRLYEKLGFLKTAEKRRWYRIM